jgi:hypothetical protein
LHGTRFAGEACWFGRACVEKGQAFACDKKAEPSDCNAISACLLIDIEPVAIFVSSRQRPR